MKPLPPILLVVFIIAFALPLPSCYSVILVNKNGTAVADPLNNEIGFFNGKEVIKIDTTIKLKLPDNHVLFFEKCPEGGFYALEYRVTLGGALLSAVTFGKRRKVKVRYVCLKQSN